MNRMINRGGSQLGRFQNLFKNLHKTVQKRKITGKAPLRRRLSLENLEDRRLLAVMAGGELPLIEPTAAVSIAVTTPADTVNAADGGMNVEIPASASTVPAGYNANDYTKLVTFLNAESAVAGVTNGAMLSANYDPTDPATWSGVTWITVDGENRVKIISWSGSYYERSEGKVLAGNLDLSDCTSLTKLNCSSNALTTLDVSNNVNLTGLYCRSNALTTLDVSGCVNLTALDCRSNALTTLDVSGSVNL